MEIEQELLRLEVNTLDASTIRNLVLYKLLEDGVITQKQYDNYIYNWQVIVIKRGWFSQWCNKYKKNASEWTFKYVKFENEDK